MGLLTWILLAVLILAVIGIGWNAFISGVFKGTEKIINSNPAVKNLTKDAKQFINNITSNYI
jgi:uncharacterized membrane protein